jgi:hypothetical protein
VGLLAVIAACGARESETQALALSWRIEPEPAVKGPALLHVELRDRAGEPVRGAAIRVEANMNHAGMVPEFGDSTEEAPGRYRVPIELTMGGDWILTFETRLADGSRHVEHRELPGVRVR